MVRRHRGARRDRLARPRRLGALAGAAAIGYRAGCFDGAPDAARRAQEDTMIRRLISLLFLAWVLGFAWFALLPPMPAPTQQKTDAIVVLTGGPGRIDRAPELLEAGQAQRVLISGVAREVQPRELDAEYTRPQPLIHFCIALGVEAEDPRPTADAVPPRGARGGDRTGGAGP